MQQYREKEIRSLKRLLAVAIGFLVIVNLAVIIFLLKYFHNVYTERNLEVNFLFYVSPTIIYIQLILLLALVPVGVIIYKRFRFVIKQIHALNDDYLQLYQVYTNSIERAYPGIPPYLISQNGFIVFKNLKHQIFPPGKIDKSTIKIRYTGGRTIYLIKIYQAGKLKVNMPLYQYAQVEFFKNHIRMINPGIFISEEISRSW